MGGGGAGATARGGARGSWLRPPPADAGPRSPHCRLEAPRPHLQADCCKREPSSSQVPVPHMSTHAHMQAGLPDEAPERGAGKDERRCRRTCAGAGSPSDAFACVLRSQRTRRRKFMRSLNEQPASSACAGLQSSTATFAPRSHSSLTLHPLVPTPSLFPHSLLFVFFHFSCWLEISSFGVFCPFVPPFSNTKYTDSIL